jgi:nitrous oxidase accessory protein NosD
VIKNCEGAINFDALPASNVTIEGIRFLCSGDGISSSDYPNAGIRIVKNEIYVQGIGLDLGSLNNATIADNKITGKVGVRLDESSSALKVSHNQIDAVSIGIAVQGSDWNQVVENRIAAGWQGILLSGEADFNQVLANKISRVEQSGVALDGDPFGNQIFGNKVVCSIGAECKAVDAQMELIEQNHIKGNH